MHIYVYVYVCVWLSCVGAEYPSRVRSSAHIGLRVQMTCVCIYVYMCISYIYIYIYGLCYIYIYIYIHKRWAVLLGIWLLGNIFGVWIAKPSGCHCTDGPRQALGSPSNEEHE